MEKEISFNNSPLKVEINSSSVDMFEWFITHTKLALKNQPNSIFWKDAVEYCKTHKKYKYIPNKNYSNPSKN